MNNLQIFREDRGFVSSDIVFGIIDKTNFSANDQSKFIIKNILDYSLQDITKEGYEVITSPDEETILNYVKNTNYKYIVMVTSGTEFIFDPYGNKSYNVNKTGDTFLEIAKNFCLNNNFFLAGHILDRGNSYYELHEQCYILNLEIYKNFNCPKIGNIEYQVEYELVEPVRSNENFHDSYTPKYIKPGNNLKKYYNKNHGWNIISFALDNNLPLIIFDESLKYNKKYYYPLHETTFFKEINFVYDRYDFCIGGAISPFNSENFLNSSYDKIIDQLVVPASGLNWVLYLLKFGYTQNTLVKFYDVSLPALQFMNSLTRWNGDDYPAFVSKFLNENINFLTNKEKILICGPKDLEKEWSKFCLNLNFKEEWEKIKKDVKFEFYNKNLLNFNHPLDWILPSKNTIVSASNIFNYVGTAPFYSVKQRVIAENTLIRRLKSINPEIYLYFSRRAAGGFLDNQTHVFQKVSNITLTNIEDLQKPSWHMNEDWSYSAT
jgi:hypothetical protein